MRKAHMVGGGVKKDKLTENEYLIYTLAVLPELVFCHGFGILKNIYEGTFVEDESKIPESIKILETSRYRSGISRKSDWKHLVASSSEICFLYFIWWMILSIYAIGCFFI